MYRESYLLFGDYPHESVYLMQNYMNNNFYAVNYQRLSTASILFGRFIDAAGNASIPENPVVPFDFLGSHKGTADHENQGQGSPIR